MVSQDEFELTITSPEGLDDEQLRQCAGLAFEAGRGYYDLIEADRDIVETQIAKQLGQPGTELERTFIVVIDSDVAGLHACVSTEVLPLVMLEGSLKLLRGLDHGIRRDFLRRLRLARPSLPTLPERSLYLARTAVSDGYRGLGVADVLMEDFLGRRQGETSYCLHVLTDNTRALRFFHRWGFVQHGEEKSGFLAMACPAASGSRVLLRWRALRAAAETYRRSRLPGPRPS